MKIHLFLLIFVHAFIFQKIACYAQRAIGEWDVYSDNRTVKDVAVLEKSVFFAFDAALLEYDIEYKEYTTWTIANGLSDARLTTLGVHPQTKTICVAYDNGNIDLIQNGRTTNIPDLRLASSLKSKHIYAVKTHGNFIYLATGLGILKIDPKKKQIVETYYPNYGNEMIRDIIFAKDSIFALTPTNLYATKPDLPSTIDPNTWIVDPRITTINNNEQQYSDIEFWNDKFYVLKTSSVHGNDSVLVISGNQTTPLLVVPHNQGVHSMQLTDGKLNVNTKKGVFIFNADHSLFLKIEQYGFGLVNANASAFFESKYWIADVQFGAVKQKDNGTFQRLSFDGPARSDYFAMKWNDGTLAVVPGFADQNTRKQLPAEIMIRNENKWTSVKPENNNLWANNNTSDLISITFNPTKPNIVAVAGVSKTPISIIDWTTGTVIDTFGQFNSTLNTFSGDSIYVSSLTYDQHGNLWIANSYCQKPLKMLDTTGQWHEFSLGDNAANKLTKRIYCDFNNDLWISVYNLGLIGFQPSASPNNLNDTKIVLLDHVLPANNSKIYNPIAFTMDFNRSLWIISDNGFAILSNPPSAFQQRPDYGQMQYPKVSYGEEVDFVLSSVRMNDIEIDGGNRKWIATQNQGAFLLSENASVVIKHFTIDNSPLMSNNILDIEIDHYTGDVFFITDRGMLSYRGDATYEDANYSNVKIFPNPVLLDHEGPIAIQGIRYDSDVKITDVAGNIVYQTKSNGGTATWNGTTTNGQRVTTGVYLIWTASNIEDLKGANARFVGKVMVVN